VVTEPAQGEVWWAETDDKRRPVLVVTRTHAVPVLRGIVVAPVTRTIRAIRTEVALGPDEGLPEDCVASFDNLRRVDKGALTQRIGRLPPDRLLAICDALDALADC
jgi:mRNA interferase MazF